MLINITNCSCKLKPWLQRNWLWFGYSEHPNHMVTNQNQTVWSPNKMLQTSITSHLLPTSPSPNCAPFTLTDPHKL